MNELCRNEEAEPLRSRLRLLQKRVKVRPGTGVEADKALFDAPSGEA